MYSQNPYASPYEEDMVPERDRPAAIKERADFLMRTYIHLFGAMIGFILIEVLFMSTGIAQILFHLAFQYGQFGWLAILGGFILVGWMGRGIAHSSESTGLQYFALAVFVAAEALIFAPFLLIADHVAPGAIQSAA